MVQRKRWLARAALLVGAGLLALVLVAATAVASPKQQAKKGGTFVVELSTDIDYIDPQLDYLSSGWEIQYAVGCKLFNYPDKPGDAGSQLTPEAAAGAPIVSKDGKTYTFKIRPGIKFSTGEAVTAASFANAINRIASQELQSPGASFIDIIQGADAALERTGEDGLRRGREGQHAHDQAAAPGTRPDRTAGDAVLPGHQPGARGRHRLAGRQHVRELRPVLRLGPDPGPVDHAEAEHVLQGQPPPQRRSDRVPDRQLAAGDRAERRDRLDRLRCPGPRPDVVEAARRQVRRQQGPGLHRAVALGLLPRDEQRPAAVQEQSAAPAGGQLRDRPSGTALAVGLRSGNPQRPHPAARRSRRVQEQRDALSAQGART